MNAFLYLFLLIECVYLFPATWATYSMSLCGEAKNWTSTTPSGPNPRGAAKNRMSATPIPRIPGVRAGGVAHIPFHGFAAGPQSLATQQGLELIVG